MFNGLLTFDKDLNIQPCLAESWENIDDCNVIFHLKKGVKFHNGDEMTAEDVKFTLDRARKSNQTSYLFAPISEVSVIDKYTVKITTDKPFGPLMTNLAQTQELQSFVKELLKRLEKKISSNLLWELVNINLKIGFLEIE